MTTSDRKALIGAVEQLAGDWSALASLLRQCLSPEARPEVPAEETSAAPEILYSYEEARAILADKARKGFRAEVKAILTRHGVRQLSDVVDPWTLKAIVDEASVLESSGTE